ncbi:hypothetical protein MUDAN_IGPPGNFN_03636 [Lactiplantibacillus mudanjiangensis]|nr:hypothetical protein MUDAN_IGPPGNFN_03636 [Lactiplantibacillus mudanjiangensis]
MLYFFFFFFFFKQKTAYEIPLRLVGSEMCIRDRPIVASQRVDVMPLLAKNGFQATAKGLN